MYSVIRKFSETLKFILGEWCNNHLLPQGHIAKITAKASQDKEFFSVKVKQSSKRITYEKATDFIRDLPKVQQPERPIPQAHGNQGKRRSETVAAAVDLTTKKVKRVSKTQHK